MTEFWEKNFREKREMWGFEPARSARLTSEFFAEEGIKNVLIPGIGYGRNGEVFQDKGMHVTGIEISKTAIELAEKRYGSSMKIYHGSVTAMPFDNQSYEGIFCHGLIHLLDKDERAKLINDCYDQLSANGYMVFTTISKKASTYGQGTLIGKDRYEQFGGVNMYFHDEISIGKEFAGYGLTELTEVVENYPFYLIKCRKKAE